MARRILPRPFLGLRHQCFLPSLSIASRWTCDRLQQAAESVRVGCQQPPFGQHER